MPVRQFAANCHCSLPFTCLGTACAFQTPGPGRQANELQRRVKACMPSVKGRQLTRASADGMASRANTEGDEEGLQACTTSPDKSSRLVLKASQRDEAAICLLFSLLQMLAWICSKILQDIVCCQGQKMRASTTETTRAETSGL